MQITVLRQLTAAIKQCSWYTGVAMLNNTVGPYMYHYCNVLRQTMRLALEGIGTRRYFLRVIIQYIRTLF